MGGRVAKSVEASNENSFRSARATKAADAAKNPVQSAANEQFVEPCDDLFRAAMTRQPGFSLPRDVTLAERQTLVAGAVGWMLDAMDVMLFSLVIGELLREFSM